MKKLKGLKKGVLALIALVVFLVGGIAVKASYPGIPIVKNIKVSNVTLSSAVISWPACDNVTGYLVYKYNTSRGVYEKVYDTKGCSYNVTNQNPGTFSKYIIKSYVNDGGIIYDSPNSEEVKVLTMPGSVGMIYYKNLKYNSVDLSWSKPMGASGYSVYSYNKKSDKYNLLLDTTSTSCTIKNLKSNTDYYFVVQAYAKKEGIFTYGYCSDAFKITTGIRPVSSLRQVDTYEPRSITLKWDGTNEADEYRIYYYSNSKDKWICDGRVSLSKNRYTIEGLNPGTSLKVMVRAVMYNRNDEAVFDSGSPTKYMYTVPDKVRNAFVYEDSITDKKAKIRWNASEGASGYILEGKASDGSYAKVDVGNKTSHTVSDLTGNTKYTYKIYAYKWNSSTNSPYCNKNGYGKVTFRTQLGNVNNLRVSGMSDRSIAFKWNRVENASGYNVYVYENDKVIDKKKVYDTFYRYSKDEATKINITVKVRAFANDEYNDNVAYSPKFTSISAANVLNTVSKIWADKVGTDYIDLKWDAVSGAKQYRIYRVTKKDGKNKYDFLGSTSDKTYTVNNLDAGKVYKFSIKCESEDDGNKLYSKVSSEYTFVTKCNAPSAEAVYKKKDNKPVINVKWSAVDEAQGYALYKYDVKSKKYVLLKTFGKNAREYNDTSVQNGKAYYYYVCAFITVNDTKYMGESSNTVTGVVGDYGIEVSSEQGKIDWKKVKDSGVTYAIIRVARGYDKKSGEFGDGSTKFVKDNRAEENISGAKEQGIKVGVYVPTYAEDEYDARKEAEVVAEYLDGIKLDYPVYYDIQGKSRGKSRLKNANTNMALEFCETIENEGFKGGIYSSADFMNKYMLAGKLSKYSIYASRYLDNKKSYRFPSDIVEINNLLYKTFYYGDKYRAINVSLWQYTGKGTVSGVKGNIPLIYNVK